MKKILSLVVICGLALSSLAAYNVRRPSDDVKPQFKGAKQGVWTLDVDTALEKAKKDGVCTILLNSGSWWCPFCETLEEKVLRSQAWKDFVEENGFYLAMLDFPYRGHVKDEEISKSVHPEFGDGWGFTCWLMDSAYLSENRLSEKEGLQAIVEAYERQKKLGENTTGTEMTIVNCLTGEEFTYRKVGYPTIIVFNEAGEECGRTSFPWYSPSQVSDEEAQMTVINAVRLLAEGFCDVCKDPESGVPPPGVTHAYNGWIRSADGICGTLQFKVAKANAKRQVKVSGSMKIGDKKASVRSTVVTDFTKPVELKTSLGGQEVTVMAKFGQQGLTGKILQGGEPIYGISGGRNVRAAATAPKGRWNVALKPADSVAPSPFACGYGALSIEIKDNGKAKVTGTLGDGSRLPTTTAQVIVGDAEMCCLPVWAQLDGKKGSIGFVAWFQRGSLLCFQDVAPWVCGNRKHPFVSKYVPTATASAGPGAVDAELELSISNFDGMIGDLEVLGDPSVDDVVTKMNGQTIRWTGSDETRLSASSNSKKGVVSGKMKFTVLRENGGTKTVTGTLKGVVVGGSCYGTLLVGKAGTWPVKIAACGGCSD